MITVQQNAYMKKAEEINSFSDLHKKILFALIYEKKYYTKEELLCLSKYNQRVLDLALKDLEKVGTIIVEGWLVRLKDFEEFNKEICEELVEK